VVTVREVTVKEVTVKVVTVKVVTVKVVTVKVVTVKVSGTVYFNFGLPCGRVVISRPSFRGVVVDHVSSPNGDPRLTLRRMAASSASV